MGPFKCVRSATKHAHLPMISGTPKHKGRFFYARTCCQPPKFNFQGWADEEDTATVTPSMQIIKELGQCTFANVDAFDSVTNTVFLYQGCRWHGCTKCNNGAAHPDHKAFHRDTVDTIKRLKEAGYNVWEKLECEDKTPQKEIKTKYCTPKDALFGGHTEVYRTKVSVVGRSQSASIQYVDIVSLYPR